MFLDKILNKNKKIEENENNEEDVRENVEAKTVSEDEISEIIEKNYSMIDNVLDIDVEPLENVKNTLGEKGNEELFEKIDNFIETIENIKNYKQDTLNDLILDIKTAKEILSDSSLDGGCILDLIRDKGLTNAVRKSIDKILYFNLQNVDNFIFVVDDRAIEDNSKMLGIKEEDFKKKMDEDPDYIIDKLLYRLTGNNNANLADFIQLGDEDDKENKKSKKLLNSKLMKVVMLSALLAIGGTGQAFAQENNNKNIEKVTFNKTNINLNDIFSSQASIEDINRVRSVFKETFKDKKILEVLDENNIIQNLGWIKAIITKIDNQDLRQNVIDSLDNDKKIAYQEFLLFINAQKYFSENNEKTRSSILQNMERVLSQIDKLKLENKDNIKKENVKNNNEKQIIEIENYILSLKKEITDKIYSTSSATMGSVYNETETMKYMSSYGIKNDRDYVAGLYKQLKQAEAKLAELKK